jgi:hypothetical protein
LTDRFKFLGGAGRIGSLYCVWTSSLDAGLGPLKGPYVHDAITNARHSDEK